MIRNVSLRKNKKTDKTLTEKLITNKNLSKCLSEKKKKTSTKETQIGRTPRICKNLNTELRKRLKPFKNR